MFIYGYAYFTNIMKTRKQLKKIKSYVPGVYKKGAIKLASNENPLGVPSKVVDIIKKNADKVSVYPDIACGKIKEKISNKLGVEKENVIVGNGSDEILLSVAMAYIEDECEVVIYKSTFSVYSFVSNLFGAKIRYVPLSNGSIKLSSVLEKITKKTKVVFLCNPNNPTGTYFSHVELTDFLKKVSKNILVVLDEAYFDYVTAKDYPNSIKLLSKYKNILILRTFSKIYGMAGLRIGFGIGHKNIIRNLEKVKMPFGVNVIAQETAIAVLDDDAFVKRSIKTNEEGKKYLYNEFDKLGLKYYSTQSNFIFIDVGRNCKDVFTELMNLGVTIRPLTSFGYKNAIRVTVGTQKQNKKFISCLKKVL